MRMMPAHMVLSLALLFASCLACQAASSIAKTCRTTLTDQEIAIARENIAKYEWAKDSVSKLRTGSMAGSLGDPNTTAEDLLALPDDQLWEIMADTSIHREYYVNQHKGCPVHGIAIKKFAVFHPWKYDPIHKPFKIQCPVGGEWYPSNDFAHGDLTSGDFPDDGTGYKKDGDTYWFIGEYSHMVYLTAVRSGLDRLSQLYALTGDRQYAHKAAVLLLRIAQQFPNSTDKASRCHWGSYRLHAGLVTDYIWSCGDVSGIATAYDLIFDALADPEIVAFASRKIPSIKTGDDLRAYVDANIIRVGAQALIDNVIEGNLGMHQRTAAILALVMDDVEGKNHPDSRDVMDWLYYKARGPARTFARNSLLKDGGAAESTGYNTSRLQMLSVAQSVDKLRARHPDAFPVSRYPDMLAEPKMKAMADYFTDMVLLDRYFPSIGDATGEPFKPSDVPRTRKTVLGNAEQFYRRFGEDRFAQMLMATDGVIAHPSVYDRPADDKIRAAVKKLGVFPKRSTSMLDGYGIAFARSGEEDDQRVAWMYYGGSVAHWHQDYLNLAYDAKGLVLIPELGYPKSWDFASTWETSIMTHNTVMIDRKPCITRDYGRLLALQSVPGIQLMDAQQDPYRAGDELFGQPDRLYRRTSLLVDLSPQDSYVADIFRVQGGTEHWQSWHGAPVKSIYEGPKMIAQPKGTLAGENVEYDTPRPVANGKPVLDAFCMFTNVERVAAAAPWSLDYDMGVKQVHARITGLPEPGTELVTADGRPPSDPNDYTIRFAFACRKGEAPLRSQFLTVIEPYSAKRIVDRIERLQATGKALPGFSPVGMRVTAGPIEDTILSTGTTSGEARLADKTILKGDTGVVRRRDGKLEQLFLSGGTYLACGDAAIGLKRAEIDGKILSVDRQTNEITVSMDIGYPEALIGRRIRIHNELRGVAYTILQAHQAGKGKVTLKLNTTSLLGEGISSGTEDGVVKNEVMLDYAGLRQVDGKWQSGISVYVGSRLEDESGKVSLLVKGVRSDGKPADTQYDVVLDPKSKPAADKLAKMLPAGTEFKLYDYGVGDQVTVPCVMSLKANVDGTYSLIATDDVTVTLPGRQTLVRATGSERWQHVVDSLIPLSISKGNAEIRIAR
jgi:hypothetical protein